MKHCPSQSPLPVARMVTDNVHTTPKNGHNSFWNDYHTCSSCQWRHRHSWAENLPLNWNAEVLDACPFWTELLSETAYRVHLVLRLTTGKRLWVGHLAMSHQETQQGNLKLWADRPLANTAVFGQQCSAFSSWSAACPGSYSTKSRSIDFSCLQNRSLAEAQEIENLLCTLKDLVQSRIVTCAEKEMNYTTNNTSLNSSTSSRTEGRPIPTLVFTWCHLCRETAIVVFTRRVAETPATSYSGLGNSTSRHWWSLQPLLALFLLKKLSHRDIHASFCKCQIHYDGVPSTTRRKQK